MKKFRKILSSAVAVFCFFSFNLSWAATSSSSSSSLFDSAKLKQKLATDTKQLYEQDRNGFEDARQFDSWIKSFAKNKSYKSSFDDYPLSPAAKTTASASSKTQKTTAAPAKPVSAIKKKMKLVKLSANGKTYTTASAAKSALKISAAAASISSLYVPTASSTRDPLSVGAGHLNSVNADTAWEQYGTGRGITVAVIDTGLASNHFDFTDGSGSAVAYNESERTGRPGVDDDGNGFIDDAQGWNFDSNNNSSYDDNGHGTHVSGIIAARKDGEGVQGLAYNSKILPVKVLDSSGSGSYEAVAKGIVYAAMQGAKIINMSLGGWIGAGVSAIRTMLQDAVNFALSRGAIVVAASGNESDNTAGYAPASLAGVITVAAADNNKNRAYFSNYGIHVSLSAPGVDILSTWIGNGFRSESGTSMSAPMVSAGLAIMMEKYGNATTAVNQLLQAVWKVPGRIYSNIYEGAGHLFFPRIQTAPPPPPPPAPQPTTPPAPQPSPQPTSSPYPTKPKPSEPTKPTKPTYPIQTPQQILEDYLRGKYGLR